MREVATLRLMTRASGETRVFVVDAAGRRVRALFQGPRAAGATDVVWDGRDDAGRRVAAGTYFVQARAGGEVSSAKVTVLR
jgi:flagellar hook assembly protein FlgD